ncbi:phosphotransferase [Thalassotalea euphylliae]|uniref:phosphotransferase n=1 Tax=Thalassotalea euphylliae TaxID=1655234 RepID=UPI00362D2102
MTVKSLQGGLHNSVYLVSENVVEETSSDSSFTQIAPQHWVAKRLKSPLTAQYEANAQRIASDHDIGANVIDVEGPWIVSEWIPGVLLADESFPIEYKVQVLVEVLSRLGSLTIETKNNFNRLSIQSVLEELSFDVRLTDLQRKLLSSANKQATNLDTSTNEELLQLVHGDLNFSNILIENEKFKVIDFESAALASQEYELAMAIAVNEIPLDVLKEIFGKLCKYKGIVEFEVVMRNLFCCYLINALWYENQYLETKQRQFSTLAAKQWRLAENLHDELMK